MRTRLLHTDDNNKKTVVWFGSYGIDSNGKAKFENAEKASYGTRQRGVADSLTQRLSIIRGELWYSISYGLPLFDKNRSKLEFDSFILQTIDSHPDVKSVISFESSIIGTTYKCNVKIQSKYGEIEINL